MLKIKSTERNNSIKSKCKFYKNHKYRPMRYKLIDTKSVSTNHNIYRI